MEKQEYTLGKYSFDLFYLPKTIGNQNIMDYFKRELVCLIKNKPSEIEFILANLNNKKTSYVSSHGCVIDNEIWVKVNEKEIMPAEDFFTDEYGAAILSVCTKENKDYFFQNTNFPVLFPKGDIVNYGQQYNFGSNFELFLPESMKFKIDPVFPNLSYLVDKLRETNKNSMFDSRSSQVYMNLSKFVSNLSSA